MLDVLKKSVFAGIGALVLTEEKVQEVIEGFVQKGELSQKEGESLIKELQKVIDANKTKLAVMIDEQIKSFLNELNVMTKDDFTQLEKNFTNDLSALEKRVAKLEKQSKASHEEKKK